MKENLYNNKESFLNLTPSSPNFLIIFGTILFMIIIFISCIWKIKPFYQTNAIYNKEKAELEVILPLSVSTKISDYDEIAIKKQKEKLNIINLSEIMIDESKNYNYQIINIQTKQKEFYHNQMIDVTFYKKEKILVLFLWDLIFKKEGVL